MRRNHRQPFTHSSIVAKNEGFTLFELLVVIAILTALSAMTIPSINSWRQNLQLNSATRDIYSNLQKAKLEAIKTRTYCTASFDANGYVIFMDADKDLVQDAGETVISSVSLSDYKNVSFDTSKGGGDGLDFNGTDDGIAFSFTGLPRNSAGTLGLGTIFLKQDNRSKTAKINITRAGNIQIN